MNQKDKEQLLEWYWKYVRERMTHPNEETFLGINVPFLGKFGFNTKKYFRAKYERDKSNKKDKTDV